MKNNETIRINGKKFRYIEHEEKAELIYVNDNQSYLKVEIKPSGRFDKEGDYLDKGIITKKIISNSKEIKSVVNIDIISK